MKLSRKVNKLYLLGLIVFVACNSKNNYVPKPHGYPKMQLPDKSYSRFDSAHVPYSFEIPNYALMEKDTNIGYTAAPTWFNLNFKPFNATLHITYYRFGNWLLFDSLVYDTRKLVNKHIQRADDIIEEVAQTNQKNVNGVIFRIEGNTATNLNFYLTDSVKHFFRGALYFNTHTKQDSIAPVYDFILKDINHLIATFKWK